MCVENIFKYSKEKSFNNLLAKYLVRSVEDFDYLEMPLGKVLDIFIHRANFWKFDRKPIMSRWKLKWSYARQQTRPFGSLINCHDSLLKAWSLWIEFHFQRGRRKKMSVNHDEIARKPHNTHLQHLPSCCFLNHITMPWCRGLFNENSLSLPLVIVADRNSFFVYVPSLFPFISQNYQLN